MSVQPILELIHTFRLNYLLGQGIPMCSNSVREEVLSLSGQVAGCGRTSMFWLEFLLSLKLTLMVDSRCQFLLMLLF